MSECRLQVGNVEIIALSDMNCVYPTPLAELWPTVPPEAWQIYREQYPDTFEGGLMRLEIGCYLVRSQGLTVLLDSGYGPGPIDYVGGLRGQLMNDLATSITWVGTQPSKQGRWSRPSPGLATWPIRQIWTTFASPRCRP